MFRGLAKTILTTRITKMKATIGQIVLIEELQNRGSTIPSTNSGNPDLSMLESFENADLYIKKWGHLMSQSATAMRADEYGGIPNY